MAATVRPGVQPGQLSAAIGAAGECAALEPDHAIGQFDQDRCKDGTSPPVRDLPDGRAGGAAEGLRRDLGANTTIRCDLDQASTYMTALNPSPRKQTPEGLRCRTGSTPVETASVCLQASIFRRQST